MILFGAWTSPAMFPKDIKKKKMMPGQKWLLQLPPGTLFEDTGLGGRKEHRELRTL